MVGVPGETPVTLPVTGSITATTVLLLLHAPPEVALLNVTAAPTQTPALPVMPVVMVVGVTASVNITEPGQPYRLVTV